MVVYNRQSQTWILAQFFNYHVIRCGVRAIPSLMTFCVSHFNVYTFTRGFWTNQPTEGFCGRHNNYYWDDFRSPSGAARARRSRVGGAHSLAPHATGHISHWSAVPFCLSWRAQETLFGQPPKPKQLTPDRVARIAEGSNMRVGGASPLSRCGRP